MKAARARAEVILTSAVQVAGIPASFGPGAVQRHGDRGAARLPAGRREPAAACNCAAPGG